MRLLRLWNAETYVSNAIVDSALCARYVVKVQRVALPALAQSLRAQYYRRVVTGCSTAFAQRCQTAVSGLRALHTLLLCVRSTHVRGAVLVFVVVT